jgi:hypothetical protein
MCSIVDVLSYCQWEHKHEPKAWRYGGYSNYSKNIGHYDKNGFYVPPSKEEEKVTQRWQDWDDDLNDGAGFGNYENSPVQTKAMTRLENVPVWGYCVGCTANKMVSYVRSVDDYICAECQIDYEL